MPVALVQLQAWVVEKLPGQLLTRDQLKMLAHDNIVSSGALGLGDLGIAATPVEQVVPEYLRRYRPGGGRRATAQAA